MAQTEAAKMFNKFYKYPDGHELSGDGNKLKKKPNLVQFHFVYHTPCIVKGNQAFPGFYSRFLKHSVQSYQYAYGSENKKY
jgi:hypothetical protein